MESMVILLGRWRRRRLTISDLLLERYRPWLDEVQLGMEIVQQDPTRFKQERITFLFAVFLWFL